MFSSQWSENRDSPLHSAACIVMMSDRIYGHAQQMGAGSRCVLDWNKGTMDA
jgi:hypothetical protein